MNTLAKILVNISSEKEATDFLRSLFSPEEIEIFEKRIKIIKLLLKKTPHREIAESLNVGIATVTRGSRELKLGHFKFLNRK